jgi:protein-tyrosine phosphatase
MDRVFWIIEDSLCGRPGPALAPWNLELIRENSIKAIISLDQDCVDSSKIKSLGFEHLSLTVPDSIPPHEDDMSLWLRILPSTLDYIEKKTANGDKVMVHCWAGKDRTGVLACSYLVRKCGYSPENAIKKLRKNRPQALTSVGYEEFFRALMSKMS